MKYKKLVSRCSVNMIVTYLCIFNVIMFKLFLLQNNLLLARSVSRVMRNAVHHFESLEPALAPAPRIVMRPALAQAEQDPLVLLRNAEQLQLPLLLAKAAMRRTPPGSVSKGRGRATLSCVNFHLH